MVISEVISEPIKRRGGRLRGETRMVQAPVRPGELVSWRGAADRFGISLAQLVVLSVRCLIAGVTLEGAKITAGRHSIQVRAESADGFWVISSDPRLASMFTERLGPRDTEVRCDRRHR